MANAADYFSGKYVTAEQLPKERHLTALITSVTEESMQSTGDTKLVLHLSSVTGKPYSKGIVLNKTNGTALSTAYGNDTDNWVGRQVELWAAQTTFAGKPILGIRLMAIGNGHSSPMSAPEPKDMGGGDLDGDTIPFAACVQ